MFVLLILFTFNVVRAVEGLPRCDMKKIEEQWFKQGRPESCNSKVIENSEIFLQNLGEMSANIFINQLAVEAANSSIDQYLDDLFASPELMSIIENADCSTPDGKLKVSKEIDALIKSDLSLASSGKDWNKCAKSLGVKAKEKIQTVTQDLNKFACGQIGHVIAGCSKINVTALNKKESFIVYQDNLKKTALDVQKIDKTIKDLNKELIHNSNGISCDNKDCYSGSFKLPKKQTSDTLARLQKIKLLEAQKSKLLTLNPALAMRGEVGKKFEPSTSIIDSAFLPIQIIAKQIAADDSEKTNDLLIDQNRTRLYERILADESKNNLFNPELNSNFKALNWSMTQSRLAKASVFFTHICLDPMAVGQELISAGPDITYKVLNEKFSKQPLVYCLAKKEAQQKAHTKTLRAAAITASATVAGIAAAPLSGGSSSLTLMALATGLSTGLTTSNTHNGLSSQKLSNALAQACVVGFNEVIKKERELDKLETEAIINLTLDAAGWLSEGAQLMTRAKKIPGLLLEPPLTHKISIAEKSNYILNSPITSKEEAELKIAQLLELQRPDVNYLNLGTEEKLKLTEDLEKTLIIKDPDLGINKFVNDYKESLQREIGRTSLVATREKRATESFDKILRGRSLIQYASEMKYNKIAQLRPGGQWVKPNGVTSLTGQDVLIEQGRLRFKGKIINEYRNALFIEDSNGIIHKISNPDKLFLAPYHKSQDFFDLETQINSSISNLKDPSPELRLQAIEELGNIKYNADILKNIPIENWQNTSKKSADALKNLIDLSPTPLEKDIARDALTRFLENHIELARDAYNSSLRPGAKVASKIEHLMNKIKIIMGKEVNNKLLERMDEMLEAELEKRLSGLNEAKIKLLENALERSGISSVDDEKIIAMLTDYKKSEDMAVVFNVVYTNHPISRIAALHELDHALNTIEKANLKIRPMETSAFESEYDYIRKVFSPNELPILKSKFAPNYEPELRQKLISAGVLGSDLEQHTLDLDKLGTFLKEPHQAKDFFTFMANEGVNDTFVSNVTEALSLSKSEYVKLRLAPYQGKIRNENRISILKFLFYYGAPGTGLGLYYDSKDK